MLIYVCLKVEDIDGHDLLYEEDGYNSGNEYDCFHSVKDVEISEHIFQTQIFTKLTEILSLIEGEIRSKFPKNAMHEKCFKTYTDPVCLGWGTVPPINKKLTLKVLRKVAKDVGLPNSHKLTREVLETDKNIKKKLKQAQLTEITKENDKKITKFLEDLKNSLKSHPLNSKFFIRGSCFYSQYHIIEKLNINDILCIRK